MTGLLIWAWVSLQLLHGWACVESLIIQAQSLSVYTSLAYSTLLNKCPLSLFLLYGPYGVDALSLYPFFFWVFCLVQSGSLDLIGWFVL